MVELTVRIKAVDEDVDRFFIHFDNKHIWSEFVDAVAEAVEGEVVNLFQGQLPHEAITVEVF